MAHILCCAIVHFLWLAGFVASTNPVADQEQPAERLGKSNETFSLPTAGTVTSTGAPPRKRATKPPVAAECAPLVPPQTWIIARCTRGDRARLCQRADPGQFFHCGADWAFAAAAPVRHHQGRTNLEPLPITPSASARSIRRSPCVTMCEFFCMENLLLFVAGVQGKDLESQSTSATVISLHVWFL